MEKKLGLKVLSSAALAGLIFTVAPALPADAATDNYASTVTKVESEDNQTLGSVIIREDGDSDGFFKPGDVITINLPAGIDYDKKAPVGKVVYSTGEGTSDSVLADYVSFDNQSGDDLWLKSVAAGDNFLSVEVMSTVAREDYDRTNGDDKESKVQFKFDKKDYSTVDIGSDVDGDVKVEIEADGTAVTSEFVTVGRVLGDGGTVTTVSDVETIGLDTTGEIGTIRITEAAVGKLEKGTDYIELTLPNDFEWDVTTDDADNVLTEITTTGGLEAEFVEDWAPEDKKDTVKIKVTEESEGTQAGFIAISGLSVYVPDDADEGEFEVTVDGNETSKEDVVIGKAGDFGFTVETDGDIPTLVAGKADQDVVQLNIDDIVGGSWIEGRKVTLELPSWASWNDVAGNGPLEGDADNLNSDKDEWKLTVGDATGKAELEDLTVDIDADAAEGDLVVKITGSQGIEEEVVIATVVPAFKVTAETPEFQIGVQAQQLGDITITESVDEAIEEGKWIVIKAPNGMYFADTPTVEVTGGDIEIDDEDTDDEYFAFRVDAESAKEASEIKISDIEMTLDRTVPVGDITFEVFMTKTGTFENADGDDVEYITYVSDDFDRAIDKDNLDEVVDVVVGKVVTPAPDEAGTNVVMNLGSTLYTVNGATKVMDVAPQVIEGRTFTPVRYVAEALGATVAYDEATKTATLTKGETVVEFVLGSSTYTVNGVAQTMDVAAQAINGRTMLPARYVAEAFGYNVGFDPATKTVVIAQ